MLFGETPGVREGVLSFVKIGLVLAFATSWPAYRTVVFDVVLRAPADLAGEIGRPAGLPGSTGGLAGQMDAADRSFRILAIYGVGTPSREQVEQANGVAPPLFANFDVFALGAARVMFLVGSLGAFALVRLSAGLLLALGPLFIAFLLFPATRGIAEGWMRGLLAATLGSAAVAVVLGVELALLDPWLADLVTRRASGIAIPGVPVAMLATASIFAIATAGLLAIVTWIAFGLRLPMSGWTLIQTLPVPAIAGQERTGPAATSASAAAEPRSRATAIADSITATQRREEQASSGGLSRAITVSGSVARTGNRTDQDGSRGTPLGQSFQRRTVRRVSGSSVNRDRPA
ncbi:type IV secretion system protein [Sphingomonas aerolata]|uniref:type IV secretion system protein n=1 Tax=Sphingomonas aerolata TaxID=185951 RepID=UPI003B8373CE